MNCKNYSVLLLLVMQLYALTAGAQAFKPAVTTGTTFSYTLDLHGQQALFELSIGNATDSLQLEWRIRRLAGGAYAMTPAARQNASMLNFAQPMPNHTMRLKDNETFFVLSKSAFKDLASKHAYTYDNTTYVVVDDYKTDPIMLDGKALDAWHVTAKDETTELWILNNPDFPMICKIKNNPMGVNAVVNAIK